MGGAIASTLVHATIVVAIMVAGRSVLSAVDDPLSQTLRFLLPADRGGSVPSEHLTYVPSSIGKAPTGVPDLEKRQEQDPGKFALPQIAGTPMQIDQPATVPAPTRNNETAFSIVDVDSAAVRDPDSAAPAYPVLMMNKGIEGYAAMRFVVDTTGRIDMGTVELLQATNPEFVQAVRQAMPRMHFRPAKMGAIAVRQLAEQLFKFEIRKVATSTDAPAKRP